MPSSKFILITSQFSNLCNSSIVPIDVAFTDLVSVTQSCMAQTFSTVVQCLFFYPSWGVFTRLKTLFNVFTTGTTYTVCSSYIWSQLVKKTNFTWPPVYRMYIEVGIFIAQCTLCTFLAWVDLAGSKCSSLSLFADWSVIHHPED